LSGLTPAFDLQPLPPPRSPASSFSGLLALRLPPPAASFSGLPPSASPASRRRLLRPLRPVWTAAITPFTVVFHDQERTWSYYPDSSPVYSLADIIRKRRCQPALTALAEPGQLTSFADLDRRSSQVAQALQRQGVAPGDRVAFIGASGPECAEVLYGAAKCRAVFTAVNNRLAPREVLAFLADAEPRILVVDPAAAPLVADASCDTLRPPRSSGVPSCSPTA
jgi:non-ribosomal peptide synthetase component F